MAPATTPRPALAVGPSLGPIGAAAGVYLTLVGFLLVARPFGDRSSVVVGNVAYLTSAAAGFTLAVLGGRQRAGRAQRPWKLLGAALLCWGVANGFWMTQEWALKHLRPVPAPYGFSPFGDLFYFAGMALLAVGAVQLLSTAVGANPVQMFFDGLLVAAATFYIAWVLLLSDLPPLGWDTSRAITWAYPIADIAIACVALIGLSRGGGAARPRWLLLSGAMLLMALGDSTWAYVNLRGGFEAGTPIDLAWIAGYLMIGMSALDADDAASSTSVGSTWSVLIPYLPFAIVALTSALDDGDGDADPVRAIAGAIAVGLLILRQVAAVLENQRLARSLEQRVTDRTRELAKSEALFREVGNAISDAVVVLNRDLTVRYASPELRAIAGYGLEELDGSGVLHLVHPDDREKVIALAAEVTDATGASTVLPCRVQRADGTYGDAEITMANLIDHPDVGGHLLAIRDVSEQRALENRLRYRAEHDDLTNLLNRSTLAARVDAMLRDGEDPTVLLLGLDGFKVVNDSFGHATGDDLLRAVAMRIGLAVEPQSHLARFGGDEFAVVVAAPSAEAKVVAARLAEALRTPFELAGREVRCTASIGVAATGQTADDRIRNADIAMYAAKERGRNTIEVFREDLLDQLVRKLKLQDGLSQALARDEFQLRYQPTVDLRTGDIVGAEALLRWTYQGSPVPPPEFIAIAEQTGDIVAIGRWVLDRACATAASWEELRPGRPPHIAVNASVFQLRDGHLVADVTDALAANGLDAGRLTVELTESAVMEHSDEVVARLHHLREMGVRVSIDDFGTGYSSLGRLQHLPVDEVKIDRSFVADITRSSDRPAVVQAVLGLAANLSLGVVAEGIETVPQLRSLQQSNCPTGQGYLFSPPVDAEQFAALLRAGFRDLADRGQGDAPNDGDS